MPVFEPSRWSAFALSNSSPECRTQLLVQEATPYFYINTPYWPEGVAAYRAINGARWMGGGLKSWSIPNTGLREALQQLTFRFANVCFDVNVTFERLPNDAVKDEFTLGGVDFFVREGNTYFPRTAMAGRRLWGAPPFVSNTLAREGIRLRLYPGIRIVAPPFVRIREVPGVPSQAYRIPIHYSADSNSIPSWMRDALQGLEGHVTILTSLNSHSNVTILQVAQTPVAPPTPTSARIQEVHPEPKKPGSIKIR